MSNSNSSENTSANGNAKKYENLGVSPIKKKRPGKLTMLNLSWLAERLRKQERIKQELADHTYSVDSDAVAKAILNQDN